MKNVEGDKSKENERAVAFCPGHVTGFFQIMDADENLCKKGSVGSGFTVKKGAYSGVALFKGSASNIRDTREIAPGFFLRTALNGESRSARELPGTWDMIENYLKCLERETGREQEWEWERPVILDVETRLELPLCQGFGMSGAALLSQIYSVNDVLGSPYSAEECQGFAHLSEIRFRTGLGDIPPQTVGGFTIRERPGIFPWGKVREYPVENTVFLLVLGADVQSEKVLRDEERRLRINNCGKGLVEALLKEPSVRKMCELSFEFAKNTGLLEGRAEEICEKINSRDDMMSSMCMLGNSLFIIPKEAILSPGGRVEEIVSELREYGSVIITAITPEGARVLQPSSGFRAP